MTFLRFLPEQKVREVKVFILAGIFVLCAVSFFCGACAARWVG